MGRSGDYGYMSQDEQVIEELQDEIAILKKDSTPFQDYIKKTRRTDLSEEEYNADMSKYEGLVAPLHYCLGIMTEAGELASLVKKEVFYDKRADGDDIKEEIGDLLWYIARFLDSTDLTFEECMEANLAKLEKRYPSGFDGTGGKR